MVQLMACIYSFVVELITFDHFVPFTFTISTMSDNRYKIHYMLHF